MSYSRWALDDSQWYVFWTSDEAQGEGPVLAIWWNGANDLFHSHYLELKKAKGNYSYILGYRETDQKERVDSCIREFLWDVENELLSHKLGMEPMMDCVEDWRPPWFESDFVNSLETDFWEAAKRSSLYDVTELEGKADE